MQISANYVLVKKAPQIAKEGFNAVEAHDDFIYKGVIHLMPFDIVYISNHALVKGDTILFAKYSPDTMEIDIEGEKMKFVKKDDILAVL